MGSVRTRLRVVLITVLMAVGLVAGAGSAAAAEEDIGHEGLSYQGSTHEGSVTSGTANKPQSKLWHVGGVWFANMFHKESASWHIFRLDGQAWVDTGVQVDDRAKTLSDALWDGEHLYIASHRFTNQTSISDDKAVEPTAAAARLYRYSYSPADAPTFTLDEGFPVEINSSSSESLTIDKDSTGRIWATWTQVEPDQAGGSITQVYVNSATGSGTEWGDPYVLPGPGTRVAPDDISAVVAFDGQIGVLWSNQLDDTVHWAMRDDDAPHDDPAAWAPMDASSEERDADDHISVKTVQSDAEGRVYAVIKTGADGAGSSPGDASIKLLTFRPGSGWTTTVFGTVADCHTRPIVMLDETNQRVHVFATGPSRPDGEACGWSGESGTIYHKSAPMDDPVFEEEGRGTPVIRDVDSRAVNDATSTKQSVTGASGLVILASNLVTQHYWHAFIDLGGAPAAAEASFTSSVTEGVAPLQVQFTDTSTGNPTAWAWDFGDGTVSTEQNPTHQFASAGEYVVTLTVTNAAGVSAPATQTVSVSAPGGGGGGGMPAPTPAPDPEPTPEPTPDPETPPSDPPRGAGSWFYLNDVNSGEANIVLSYGDPSDEVLVADTDGRNGDSLLIRRGNEYFVRNALSTGVAEYAFLYGDPGDVVHVGDWDGDGQDTLMVRRGNTYFVKNSTTTGTADAEFTYGNPGDTILVGDWDGDGVDTLAVKRGNTYFIRNSLTSGVADSVITYGNPGDTVLVGNWNGRTAGLAVQRGNTFYLKYELTSGVADVVFGYGNPGDRVLVGDWNGDGVDSLGVRRIF